MQGSKEQPYLWAYFERDLRKQKLKVSEIEKVRAPGYTENAYDLYMMDSNVSAVKVHLDKHLRVF